MLHHLLLLWFVSTSHHGSLTSLLDNRIKLKNTTNVAMADKKQSIWEEIFFSQISREHDETLLYFHVFIKLLGFRLSFLHKYESVKL